MVIKEIYHQGDIEVDFYLVDPIDSFFDSATALTFNTLIESSYGGLISTYPYLSSLTGGAQ
jgi:hypothetical protein